MKLRYKVILVLVFCLFAGLVFSVEASEAEDRMGLEQLIIESCLYERSVDISRFNISKSELESILTSLRSSGQLPWYTDSAYSYKHNDESGLVTKFIPKTIYNGDIDKVVYEQKVAEILNECVHDGMSQHQKALAIHDYLVVNFCYDESLTKSTGYDLLVNGTAVCAGYAAAYQDLLKREGIDCILVVSETMSHGWNLVCIDNQWYHVDVTWDDPVPDRSGFVSHEYFLLTDEQIESGDEPHYDWDTSIVCADTRFTNAYWRNVYSRICYENNESCYLLRSQDGKNRIYKRNEVSGREIMLYSEKNASADIGFGNYIYHHQGLSLVNEKLYFSTLDKLLSMSPDDKGVYTEYTYNLNGNQKYICGSHVIGSYAYLSVADHMGNIESIPISLSNINQHVHSYTETVIAPTCIVNGYTVFACECGFSFQSNITEKCGHSYQLANAITRFFKNGYFQCECSECGDTVVKGIADINLKEWISENLYVVVLVYIGVLCLLFRIKKPKKSK